MGHRRTAIVIVTTTILLSLTRIDRYAVSFIRHRHAAAFAPRFASAFARQQGCDRPLSGSVFGKASRLRKGHTFTGTTAMMSDTNGSNEIGLVSFLRSRPSVLTEPSSSSSPPTPIHLYLGNEAGDADSIVSALGLAYVDSLADTDTIHVPLMSVPRADLPLRRDALLLLDLAGIDADAEQLLCIDDGTVVEKLIGPTPKGEGACDPTADALTLVDHNRIRTSLSHLSSSVTEIVDHHEDEGDHAGVTVEDGSRIIAFEDGRATVASTCTLVAERLFRVHGGSSSDDDGETTPIKIDRGIGLVLLGVILLDSMNMLPEAGRGTPRDDVAIRELLERTDWSSAAANTAGPKLVDDDAMRRIFPDGTDRAPDRESLFRALSDAKTDAKFWDGMSVRDCLRIDYKKFAVQDSSVVPSIGLSSVLIGTDAFAAKEGFRSQLESYVLAEDVPIFGVLSLEIKSDDSSKDGKATLTRELILAGPNGKVVDSFADYLLLHPDAAFLEVEERTDLLPGDGGVSESNTLHIRSFRQGNAKGSRKQVAPTLLKHATTLNSRL